MKKLKTLKQEFTFWLVQSWYQKAPWLKVFYGISAIFATVVRIRRFCYLKGYCKSEKLPVPIIVVGNITIGGTGKTPFVIWLVAQLRAKGLIPGVVSRGYGRVTTGLHQVQIDSLPENVGDEPLLIKWRTECPVVVAEDRVLAARDLIAQGCNIIISDDGLQHYKLIRDLEIIVVDGMRQLGNGHCLPAGPLREPVERLQSAHFVVTNMPEQGGQEALFDPRYTFTLQGNELINLKNSKLTQPLTHWRGRQVRAIAGIGHPERFFLMLHAAGLQVLPQIFPDHHHYRANDLKDEWLEPVIMTEKDAVKWRSYAREQDWYLPVQAIVSTSLQQDLLSKLGDYLAPEPSSPDLTEGSRKN